MRLKLSTRDLKSVTPHDTLHDTSHDTPKYGSQSYLGSTVQFGTRLMKYPVELNSIFNGINVRD